VEGDDAGGEEVEADVGEAGVGHELGKGLGRGKFLNRVGKVGVGGGIAGDGAADARKNAREIEAIRGTEHGALRLGEFENGKAAAGIEDAEKLGKAAAIVGKIAEAKGSGEEVEGRVGAGQSERVPFKKNRTENGSGAAGERGRLESALRVGATSASPEWNAKARASRFPALLLGPADGAEFEVGSSQGFAASDLKHGMSEVGPINASAAADGAFVAFFVGNTLQGKGEVAGATADVEDAGVSASQNVAKTTGSTASPDDVETE